ncbi:MAG: hypothetical protein IJ507_06530 [Clostridia bacterium]|nr:hypothetical protein [Clostridia bacterium]
MKRKKLKAFLSMALMMLAGVIAGLALGFAAGHYLDSPSSDGSLSDLLLIFAGLMFSMYLAAYVQIILHEIGHLIFGLLTGYRFVSFRIGSVMLIRRGGRLKLCRFSLAGTGGQCIMDPPGELGRDLPVMLYNFGGVIMNLLSVLLALPLLACLPDIPMLRLFLLSFALFGFVFALTNGIPLKGKVNNDGSNAFALRKNAAARRSIWIQLKGNALIAQGVPTQDMPEEWFVLPSDEEMKNSIVAPLGPLCSDRLMAQHRFREAAQLQDQLLRGDNAIVPVHRALLVNDRVFCEIMGDSNAEVIDALMTKETRRLLDALKSIPSVWRTRYACALTVHPDEKAAANALRQFEKIAASYPYPAELAHERSLITLVEEKNASSAQ